MDIIKHAKRELKLLKDDLKGRGTDDYGIDYDNLDTKTTKALVKVISDISKIVGSKDYDDYGLPSVGNDIINILFKLLRFSPLTDIDGNRGEWQSIVADSNAYHHLSNDFDDLSIDNFRQHRRCPWLLKDPDGCFYIDKHGERVKVDLPYESNVLERL